MVYDSPPQEFILGRQFTPPKKPYDEGLSRNVALKPNDVKPWDISVIKHENQVAMDWYYWLSKSGLEPSLIYEYGLVFARNELEKEDLTHFNHEFLQSMGISVGKHRLEILKLAKKEVGGSPRSLSRLFSAINKTKSCLTKSIGRWVFHKDSAHISAQELTPYRAQWTGALRKHNGSEEKAEVPNRGRMRSGPLDRRAQERLMATSRNLSVSGPLDGNVNEKFLFTYRSPTASGPLDGRMQERMTFPDRSPKIYGPWERGLSPKVNSPYRKEKMDDGDGPPPLWSLMFQDMKPT
ncbi:hypothetical protein F0562_009363 [Nyssa sinensis]|uniref:SAM domain-containing protein n=1 Tax=Nyssa sinensis TaxID=561372 RepID=A0A5J4ZX99_9ASTE|nr:hypothetical protein F0562_009363 [Nyssa sinensis]